MSTNYQRQIMLHFVDGEEEGREKAESGCVCVCVCVCVSHQPRLMLSSSLMMRSAQTAGFMLRNRLTHTLFSKGRIWEPVGSSTSESTSVKLQQSGGVCLFLQSNINETNYDDDVIPKRKDECWKSPPDVPPPEHLLCSWDFPCELMCRDAHERLIDPAGCWVASPPGWR